MIVLFQHLSSKILIVCLRLGSLGILVWGFFLLFVFGFGRHLKLRNTVHMVLVKGV